MAVYVKDPNAVLDYGFDWEDEDYLASGETISTSTWTIPSGLTEGTSSNSDTQTSVWISGGTEGTDYHIVNHIVTSAGREDDRTHVIKVRSR